MSKKFWDVIVVGGGPAGITAALRLARQELKVLVVEAAVYPGAENWSGAVYFAENLADPEVLGNDELERAPYERRVVKRGFFTCNGLTLAGAEYDNPETFRHCYTVLRPIYDRYLAERARQLGATILNETTVDGLIRHGNQVVGVHTDRGPLYGDIVFLAEGDAAHLVSKEGFEPERVRAKKSGQPAFLQGVKEVIELDPELIEERFRVSPGEACCYEVLLRNGVVDGRPVRLNMAGFLYTNRSSISIGLVLPLDNLATYGGSYNALMEWFKGLPPIQRLIEGGESTSYGAKIIRGGGLKELPQLVDSGVAIGGAATGIGIDFPYPNFTGPATAMGRILADAVLELRRQGQAPTRERLEELYVSPLQASHYYRNVEHLRDWPAFIEHTQAFFSRQVDLLNGTIYVMTRPDLRFGRKWWEATRVVGETLGGKWLKTVSDIHQGSKALRLGRYVLKHAPVALLAAIPNTLIALLPFAWGRPVGQLRFSFWVKDEEPGRLPWYKRWVGARFGPGLSKAADVLYANDDRSIGQKLDRCIGIILRRISLWEVLAVGVGLVALTVTRVLQRLSDVVRYAIRKPTLEQLKQTFYGRWLMRWRALTDLSPGRLAIGKSHDAKLGEISYDSEPASHIKVFFPPERAATLEDPSRSSLWSVCPAAVYQINQDRTLHSSVTVNFENCVKCETCWRIQPQHVDWTRFGEHRLVYEVYTEADGALRRIISERDVAPSPDVTADFWSVTLASDGDEGADAERSAPKALRLAITRARTAISRAQAKCTELSENIWRGPRVLEPGQVRWYQSAVAYCTSLAEEAADAALREPISSCALECNLGLEHSELLQVSEDLKALAGRARVHAAARRFFAAEADARQIRDHHLEGLRAGLDRVAENFAMSGEDSNPVAEARALETEYPARKQAREKLREHLSEIFDRGAIHRLEHGGALEGSEIDLIRAAARAALGAAGAAGAAGDEGAANFEDWGCLTRESILAEFARVDPSLATIIAGHLAAVAALERSGAPESTLGPLKAADYVATVAMEWQAEAGDSGWRGRIPFVLAAQAEAFIARGVDRLGLFLADAPGVRLAGTPTIGLTGARVSELSLEGARPTWEGEWSEDHEATLFAVRARDVAAIALGAGTLMTERAVDHARSRVQFPDHFQDIDGRDAIGKFGAVREHISHIEVRRLAIETLVRDARWTHADLLAPLLAKVAVTDLFGPDVPSITYRTGQVIGGAAFSEDDIIAKIYRDSSVFAHYIKENALLNREIGARLAADLEARSLPNMLAGDTLQGLAPAADRPVLDVELKRLRVAGDAMQQTLRAALADAGDDEDAIDVVHDIVGELASRIYVWVRLFARAHRRLEAALPAQRFVEAVQLWADIVEERLVMLDQELELSAHRAKLGAYTFTLGDYPDEPVATGEPGFSYQRDIVDAERRYRSGEFLLTPLDLDEVRYVPELVWGDDVVRLHYEEYLNLFRCRFVEPHYDPPFDRYIEQLHHIPRGHIDWTREQGFFRVVIPKELGGQGRWKADYYSLCQISKRLADVSHTLTIQANTSIGTTPILLGLYQDIPAAERDLRKLMDQPETVESIERAVKDLVAMLETPNLRHLQKAFMALSKEVGATVGRSRILKKVVFGTFINRLEDAGLAGMRRDLEGFRCGLEKALTALEGWRERARDELRELPRRREAHEFFLRLISARMISAFALTEPSAGSDTARIRTEAQLTSRRVHTDEDGVRYFYLDEEANKDRRNVCDMRRFEFDGLKILYRYDDEAEPAEVLSHEYSYTDDIEKYRYYMHGGRRVDVHDIALIREGQGEEIYEFYVMNGAKMWITNGHIAGVMSLYARTPMGPTGFMVDTHAEGFLVGKDEEKSGQRGSPTNEITLTKVRVPRECMIGIEGRGQENALETLNVGRAGLCISASAGMQQAITDARDYALEAAQQRSPWVRYRLGLALEEMFATESLAYNLIGLADDETSDSLRMESAIGKFFGTEGAHRLLRYLEPIYCIEGQTHHYRIEKDRRDARVMTIYEGTNEVQQFLLLKDLIDMVGPEMEDLEQPELSANGSAYAEEVRTLGAMRAQLHERVVLTRKTYGSAAWQRALLQPIFFRLSQMAVWAKMVDSVVHRAHWIDSSLTAEGDADHRDWSDLAARGFVARARREFTRLVRGFDRDFEILRSGGRPTTLKLAETVFDAADAAEGGHAEQRTPVRVTRTPITRELRIVVALEQAPRLAPRPRVENGRVAEHVFRFTAGDRRALRLALGLKEAAPDTVQVTLISAAPAHAEERLRLGLAAGADRAILLDIGGERYAEHAVAEALAKALEERGIEFDLVLAGASEDSPTNGRLAGRLATEYDIDWVPALCDLWVHGDRAVFASARFPDTTIETELPVVAAVSAPEGEPEWEFTTAGFIEALGKPLEIAEFPSDADRSDEQFTTAAVTAAADDGQHTGRVEPERAAEVLIEVGDLGDGASAPESEPYSGAIHDATARWSERPGVMFVPELEDGDLARSVRAPLEAARGIAAQSSLPLTALVLSEPLEDQARRRLAGQLRAHAPFSQIVFAEHPALATASFRAHAEALVRLVGPEATARPAYLLTSPWLSDALLVLAESLRDAGLKADELPGISRVEFQDGDGVTFIRPALERKLRARTARSAVGEGIRILWCEPEVSANGGQPPESETAVVRVPLELEYDPQTDALAQALANAKQELGVVTLENAEFIIDVGAGLGSGENIETVVEPLRQALLELGAPHVEIGASRKVTQDLSWLPDDRQIGQTGVRVNPRVMITLGISGAPQHIDYIGDRAVIFAFNLDAQAPLMTLNQRREAPKVYPVVGDLFETLPKFVEALKSKSGQIS